MAEAAEHRRLYGWQLESLPPWAAAGIAGSVGGSWNRRLRGRQNQWRAGLHGNVPRARHVGPWTGQNRIAADYGSFLPEIGQETCLVRRLASKK